MKSIAKILTVITLLLSSFYLNPQSSYADTFGNTRAFHGVNLDSSTGGSFTYNGSTYRYSNVWDAARRNWDGHSGISLTYSSHGWSDKYYVGTTSDPDLLGKIFPVNGYGDYVGVNEYWLYAKAYIYNNVMNNFNMTNSQRVSNATHEIGHTLKLAHPTDDSVVSVMRQGIRSIGPTTYDYNELDRKWSPSLSSVEGSSVSSDSENSNIKTISLEGNYIQINSAEELYNRAELIIVAEPLNDFMDRNHVSSYSDDGSLEDYYTETVVNIKQIIKKPSDLEIVENQDFQIVEPPVGLIENSKKEKVKIVTDEYAELKKNKEYLIFLKKNVHGDYALISNELSKYDLDGLAEDDTSHTHDHHKEDKEKIGNGLKKMLELQNVKGIENLTY